MPISVLSLKQTTFHRSELTEDNRVNPVRTHNGTGWITVSKRSPYFEDEHGNTWTPIGQNDAITWPDLAGLFRRRDMASVEEYLSLLVRHGVTVLRLMLEYCHGEHRYLERPVGCFQPNMVRLWDDLFTLCEKHGLRILLTPYDTFWMWIRWAKHPYNTCNGGMCDRQGKWLLSPEMRSAIKSRLEFATTRWGGSDALFAWDIWNEIHPAHGGDSAEAFAEFVEDVSGFLRKTERRVHGRTHPQTVSLFGPVMEQDPRIVDCAFRHPALDFASIHFYESDTIDSPKNTIDPAISAGRLTRQALTEIADDRPFFDSEHGPIHTFKDHHKTLPEPFDNEYFRHIQWAHFASGGAGGGMRWANRHPHVLTPGMREAQSGLAAFLPMIYWRHFRRRNLNHEIRLAGDAFAPFGCADETQAIVWLLRRDQLNELGMVRQDAAAVTERVSVPGMKAGRYRITAWDTAIGKPVETYDVSLPTDGDLCFTTPPIGADRAFAIRQD